MMFTAPETGVVASADERLSLAFYSPSCPPGNDSNGVVTYVSTILPELQAQGHIVSILSSSVTRDTPTQGTYGFDEYLASRTLPNRLLDRLTAVRGHDHALERTACRA